MSTEPKFVLLGHINIPNDPSALEILGGKQESYVGRKDTYYAQEKLPGLCGSYLSLDGKNDAVFLKAFDNPKIDEDTMRDLYRRELRAAKDLAPLNIALPIQDTGREHLFIVQEFAYGRTLDSLLTIAGPVREEYARKIMTPIVRAVKEAHAKGYTHRDLKPDNIFYRTGDFELEHPIILDWGFSCHESERDDIEHCVGTPHYAAPEQFKPFGIADERSDIYSLGIILYKLLTGAHPYTQKTAKMEELARQKESAHNPKTKRPSASAQLSLITLKMTQPDKKDRHQTIDELMEDLKTTTMGAR